jgi:hypothetical protein
MRLVAAVTLLAAAAAASNTESTGENQSTLSRRHLLYHKHRLFQQKLRLDHRNQESDSPIKHKKKSKMGDSWYDLDAANSLDDVEEQEEEEEEEEDKQVLEKQAPEVDATVTEENNVTTNNPEEDCEETIRRHLAKTDKAGKDTKVKMTTPTTTWTWAASTEEAKDGGKSGKPSKGTKAAKGAKRGKSTTVKCHTDPPQPSGKPTNKPSQETQPATSSPTSKPIQEASPEPTTFVTETKPPVTTEPPVASTTESPTVAVTESPMASLTTESPTSSPSAEVAITESPTASTATESPSFLPSAEVPVTESPMASLTTEPPSISPSAEVAITESPTASAVTESPSTLPSAEVVVTESPTASTATESPSFLPSAEVVVTESPTVSAVTESPSTLPSAEASGTESPVASTTTQSPTNDSSDRCTFCEAGIPDPDALPPAAQGLTCAEVKESAEQFSASDELCKIVQAEEATCCPSGVIDEPCVFCEGGVSDPEAIPPASNGQTCAEIEILAASEAGGSPICTTLQAEESTCCPPPIDNPCAFCQNGIPDPELVPPNTSGQTCAEIQLLAAGEADGSPICTTVQEEEATCCPSGVIDEPCVFCEGGVSDPEAIPPASNGQTCAEIEILAASEAGGSPICTILQAEQSTCCPESTGGLPDQSCAPFEPNPYTFEPPNNDFPKAPWTTGGDGVWTIDDANSQEGTYAIKSPNLEGSSTVSISNATLTICSDFAGGTLSFNVLAPVLPPHDFFIWYVDGVEVSRLANALEWRSIPIPLTPGAHIVDFQYQYNPNSVPDLSSIPFPPDRQGAVWIDALELQ